ncbi:uncharacterized protein OCT59_009368 [Rhizophagus irregularis]|uniref:uncharacterized protein n=1 Tax=Rhizophagus irregularis TaxID=588596 RepID=UPI00332AA7AA|nr:hypothetical protein OCT59_009368 [Rhizophagus irregularis]
MVCQTSSDILLRDISNLYDKADDYNVKIQVGEDSKMEIFKAHSVILRARYIYTGIVELETVNVENNFIELFLAADEMNLCEITEHLCNNHWIMQNSIKLFNTISCRKVNFPKLKELCYNTMIQTPKLYINSDEFLGLDYEVLLTIIQLDNLEMKEIVIWENLIKWGIAKNSTFNSDMTTWTINEYEILKETISPFIQHIRFFQMTPQEYYYKVHPLDKLLPKEIKEDLLLYFIVPDCKLTTKVLPLRKSQYVFDSFILKRTHFNLISYWIENGQELLPNPLEDGQYEFNLLLRGSRDGFEPKDFHLKCNNKGATIVIIKLKNLDKMIGGYNPIKWSGSNKYLKTDKSFIFSFSNNLCSSKIKLSRVKNSGFAISDGNIDRRYHGFGYGDLDIFEKSCKLEDYSIKIHDSENFEIDDYEVFQVVKKE